MKFDYSTLQEILAAWPTVKVPEEQADDALGERIRQVLRVAYESLQPGPWRSDLQPLLRQFLLRQTARTQQQFNLLVPRRYGWPTATEWAGHGVATLSKGDESLFLTAQAWHPSWLGGGESGVFADAFTDRQVRQDGRCPADPFFTSSTGYEEYSCPGQREAIRAAFLMRPGHTLIVNLPTGSGKSLVGQAPALSRTQEGSLTLFVVPTVALAIDQERQMTAYFLKNKATRAVWPLAWHGGLSPEGRSEVRRRMREGTQRILFTSPEALTTSLLKSIFEVAREGLLRYFVIDEAHLVTQWGDEFRPAFQALAGLRNALLRQSNGGGFRTMLLSATFTTETVDTLANLFGPPDRVEMISAVHLRPEPQYWFYRASSRAEKEERVLEALRYAPRPFVLYVTTRKDAYAWLNLLETRATLGRIQCFHGGTPDQKREEIIREWAGNQLDGVVATSAFGVGIDKGDVRTVIHATIPETLDRFYQEVGRGGRDGCPSISLLVYDETDWGMPERLATPKIISDELGFERWKSIYASRTSTEDGGLIKIDLEAVPAYLRGSNEYSVSWNMRTLLLMSRARLIELDVEPSSSTADQYSDEFTPSSPLAAMAAVRVRIINGAHQLSDVWEKAIGPIRSRTQEAAEKSFGLLKRLLTEGGEVSLTLSEFYRIRSARWPVDVVRVCGGCPSDRFSGERNIGYHVPIATPIHNVGSADFSSWTFRFPWLNPVSPLVFYDDEIAPLEVHQAIIKFVGWLVGECGVQELASDGQSALSRSTLWRNLYRRSPTGVLIHRDLNQLDEEPYSPLARVTVVETPVSSTLVQKLWMIKRPHHLVLLPKRTPDPRNPRRLLIDVDTNIAHLDFLLAAVSQ